LKKSVEFYSEGSLIKGNLYNANDADGESKLPGIIMCHGFAGIKELLLPNYAEKFAEAGFVVLTFDYRGFGESEGKRGDLNKTNQIVDIRNAITFLTTLPEVEKNNIGLWGTSYGGANAIVTSALDKRIKCLSVQLTFGSGKRVILGDKNEDEQQKILDMVNKIWTRQVTQNRSLEMGVDRYLTDEQSIQFYKENVEKFPELKIKIPFSFMKETIEYIPEDYIHKINIPILLVGAENDKVNPIEETKILFEKANEPKSLLIVKNATHYEVYEGEPFEIAVKKEVDWFQKYLS